MRAVTAFLTAGFVLLAAPAAFAAETLHLVVMSPVDAAREAPKYEALSAYLTASNPLLGDIKLRIAKNFPEAARLFEQGDVEGMFSASFVASVLIAKGVARPVARPLRVDGVSTYSTSIVAREGTGAFGGVADFKDKRVAYCLLASAGEVFLRSLLGPGQELESVCVPVPVDSHQAALEAVLNGAADYAVVKNTVFSPERFPGLAVVGADAGEHPDNTFMMPKDAHDRVGALIGRVLRGLEADTSEKAEAVRQAFGCKAFIATGGMDFAHTFSLLKKTGVDPKSFDFVFSP